jgi:hypothetical protein
MFFEYILGRENTYQPPQTMPFKDILDGVNPFYDQPDYLEATKRDFSQKESLPVSYTWNTQHKIIRVAKQILSIIIFPIAIYNLIHALVGKIALLPASTPTLFGFGENHADDSRSQISLNSVWKYKRFTAEVDGTMIDATIVGKASTLNNGRWVLASNGNAEYYEDKLLNSFEFRRILAELKGNAIVFNYPGVGASSDLPNRQTMAKAYRLMLKLLEDQEKGIGAKEIIGYGFSIGGGVQGDALNEHKLKKEIKYVFVKSKTFDELSTTAAFLTRIQLVSFLIKIIGWNMGSVESSKKLQAPEIILQTAAVANYEELVDSSKIIDDGIIPAQASLAKTLLDDPECPKNNKVFIGIPEMHGEALRNPTFLVQKIEALLS